MNNGTILLQEESVTQIQKTMGVIDDKRAFEIQTMCCYIWFSATDSLHHEAFCLTD